MTIKAPGISPGGEQMPNQPWDPLAKDTTTTTRPGGRARAGSRWKTAPARPTR